MGSGRMKKLVRKLYVKDQKSARHADQKIMDFLYDKVMAKSETRSDTNYIQDVLPGIAAWVTEHGLSGEREEVDWLGLAQTCETIARRARRQALAHDQIELYVHVEAGAPIPEQMKELDQ